jgi:hypothetical protein
LKDLIAGFNERLNFMGKCRFYVEENKMKIFRVNTLLYRKLKKKIIKLVEDVDNEFLSRQKLAQSAKSTI